ncbi:MAG: glycosyltransferase family 4 protein [Nitrosomonadales bacterium]|jgi:glycosyltransferase involved in cell wall biosynthesis|nr:glycosyltransferase family 4 protein [Nitrosomonadales bacterium]MBT5573537.1 glycosyltransferase family 4 protein [Nitrosomonadales bacterium]
MVLEKKISVVQVLPDLNSGGVERGTLEVNKYLANIGHRSIVISNGGRMVEQILKDNGEHYKLAVGKKNLFTIFTIFKLIKFMKVNKVDVVHARSRLPAWVCYLALRLIKKTIRPIFITTVHGPYSVNFYSSIMTKGDRVIVVSKMIEQYVLQNYKVDKNKLFLNYRGVSNKEFPYKYRASQTWLKGWYKEFPQTKNKIILTLPARITRWKGQDDFISLLKGITAKYPNVHGLIVGDEQKKYKFTKELKVKIRRLRLSNNITLVGHRKDLRDVMSISKIVFSLSREPEAFGRVSLESLSLGIPVIAYSHGGVEEQLKKLLPEGLISIGKIDNAINLATKWIADPPKIKQNNFFTLEKMLQNTLHVYNKTIKEKRNHAL